MGSAGLRALVVLSDASCVGRESLHACCEFAGIGKTFIFVPRAPVEPSVVIVWVCKVF